MGRRRVISEQSEQQQQRRGGEARRAGRQLAHARGVRGAADGRVDERGVRPQRREHAQRRRAPRAPRARRAARALQRAHRRHADLQAPSFAISLRSMASERDGGRSARTRPSLDHELRHLSRLSSKLGYGKTRRPILGHLALCCRISKYRFGKRRRDRQRSAYGTLLVSEVVVLIGALPICNSNKIEAEDS